LSFQKLIVPEGRKRSCVIPLHKYGNKEDVNNSRPISILPVISKTFEKIMHDKTSEFAEEKEIIPPSQ
jgi:hypothetical protein